MVLASFYVFFRISQRWTLFHLQQQQDEQTKKKSFDTYPFCSIKNHFNRTSKVWGVIPYILYLYKTYLFLRASIFLPIFYLIGFQWLQSYCRIFIFYVFVLKIEVYCMNSLVEFHDCLCRRPDWMTIIVPVGLNIYESINIWIWYNLECCFHGFTWD